MGPVSSPPTNRPRKQEQEPATETITELAPGVLRTELPIQLPGLGHVNCYVLEDDRGAAIVDPGLPSKDSYRALEQRLRAAGIALRRVHTVIVTHSHPDHFGGAGFVHAQSGAEVVTHAAFRMMWDPTHSDDVDFADPIDDALADDTERRHVSRFPWEDTPWGGPGIDVNWKRRLWFHAAKTFPQLRRVPSPTKRVQDADRIVLAGREWVAVHTPGHTADHLCLYDPECGLMLSGDHVLPTITPHIGGLGLGRDALGLFFRSLDKVAEYGPSVRLALPAHGKPFADLAGRAHQIQAHHLARLQLLRDTSEVLHRPADVMEYSTYLFSERARGAMADSETFAHLEHLRYAGEMVRTSHEGRFEYVLAD